MTNLTIHLLFFLAWLVLHGSSLAWLGRSLWTSEGSLHLGVAVLWCGLLLRGLALGAVWIRLAQPARASLMAWGLAVGLPVLFRLFGPDFQSVGAMVMLASLYGVAGLFLDPRTWRRLLPVALLAGGILPLSHHLDVLFGLPLRSWTASIVAVLFGSLESATVLQVEGGYAFVDLPCSGVQSLWSGGVILAAATVAWGRAVRAPWFLLLGLTWGLLVLVNTLRVATLVGLHHQLGQPLLAEVLHTPIGLVGFLLALLPGLLGLWWMPVPREGMEVPDAKLASPGKMVLATVILVGLALLPVRRVEHPLSPAPLLPAGWTVLEPTQGEADFIGGRGGSIRKAAFQTGALQGSVAVISSRSWVAQHVPELCYNSEGWTLLSDHPTRVGATPVRWASLEREGDTGTAIWWFESEDRVTDDHTVRIADGLVSDRPWLLVSLFVAGTPSPNDPDLLVTLDALRQADRLTFDTLTSLENP